MCLVTQLIAPIESQDAVLLRSRQLATGQFAHVVGESRKLLFCQKDERSGSVISLSSIGHSQLAATIWKQEAAAETGQRLSVVQILWDILEVNADHVVAGDQVLGGELDDRVSVVLDDVVVVLTASHSLAVQPHNVRACLHDDVLPRHVCSVAILPLNALKRLAARQPLRDGAGDQAEFHPGRSDVYLNTLECSWKRYVRSAKLCLKVAQRRDEVWRLNAYQLLIDVLY